MQVVEVIQSFPCGTHTLVPGDRLLARAVGGTWLILFNGAEIPAPGGTVGAIDSPEVARATQRRSAREEEYQTAKP